MIKHVHRGEPPFFSGHYHWVLPDVVWSSVTLEQCPVCGRTVIRGMGRWWEYWVPTPAGVRTDPGE